jgi:hypothetical protein
MPDKLYIMYLNALKGNFLYFYSFMERDKYWSLFFSPKAKTKTLKPIAVCLILLSSLFISTCDGAYINETKSFDRKLRGTWVSNETGLYSGSLKIDSYTITIDGYGEDWTPLVGDDSKRPFKDFPKRLPLSGYSEEGVIYITYKGTRKTAFPLLIQK